MTGSNLLRIISGGRYTRHAGRNGLGAKPAPEAGFFCEGAQKAALFDGNRDPVRHHGRIVRDVAPIADTSWSVCVPGGSVTVFSV